MVALSRGRSSVWGSQFVRKWERTDNRLRNLTLFERRLPPKGRRFDIVHELPPPKCESAVAHPETTWGFWRFERPVPKRYWRPIVMAAPRTKVAFWPNPVCWHRDGGRLAAAEPKRSVGPLASRRILDRC